MKKIARILMNDDNFQFLLCKKKNEFVKNEKLS